MELAENNATEYKQNECMLNYLMKLMLQTEAKASNENYSISLRQMRSSPDR